MAWQTIKKSIKFVDTELATVTIKTKQSLFNFWCEKNGGRSLMMGLGWIKLQLFYYYLYLAHWIISLSLRSCPLNPLVTNKSRRVFLVFYYYLLFLGIEFEGELGFYHHKINDLQNTTGVKLKNEVEISLEFVVLFFVSLEPWFLSQ